MEDRLDNEELQSGAVNVEAAEANKKKKTKKIVTTVIIIVVVLIGLAAASGVVAFKLLKKNTDTSVKVEAKSNQMIEYVQVNSISGNEITYTLLKESDFPGGNGEMPSFSGSDGERPSFSGADGEMPSFGDGEKPSDFPGGNGEMPNFENGEMPSFGGKGDGNRPTSGSSVLTYDGKTYSLSDVTQTTMIPVGTDVTTKLGTVTTFSRIQNGDCLALVTEIVNGEKTIVSVYIVG